MTLESVVRSPKLRPARCFACAGSSCWRPRASETKKSKRFSRYPTRGHQVAPTFFGAAPGRLAGRGGTGPQTKYNAEIRHCIAATACGPPPASVGTHWSVRTLAKHLGVDNMVVQSVLAAESIQSHRFRYWKHWNDPEFEPKKLAVVGLCLAPPQNAVVLSVDEKTSIQGSIGPNPVYP